MLRIYVSFLYSYFLIYFLFIYVLNCNLFIMYIYFVYLFVYFIKQTISNVFNRLKAEINLRYI